jgi:hypothetical protein
MKTLIILLALAVTALAQQPQRFLWIGSGLSYYDETKVVNKLPSVRSDARANLMAGYGERVADGTYVLTDLVMTRTRSTLTANAVRYITQQGAVTLFALGGIGGSSEAGVVQLALQAGGGVLIKPPLKWRLENWRLVGAVKITKPNGVADTSVVMPQVVAGISYMFGFK